MNSPGHPGVDIQRNFGPGNGQAVPDNRHAQTFATLLTAAYVKRQVSDAYNSHLYAGDTLNRREMRIYTIGINTQTSNSPSLAEIVLDPRNFLHEDPVSPNKFSKDFVRYAEQYFGAAGSVDIINSGWDAAKNDLLTTNFKRNPPLLGVESIDDLRYNDGFYSVQDQGADLDWSEVFKDVISHVTSSAPKVPTQTESGDLDASGYITYVDPIGEYMEIKQVKQLIYNHQVFSLKNPDGERDEDGVIHYYLSGSLDSPTNTWVNLDDIQITARETDGGYQQLEVRIPASLIPLRVNTIVLDEDKNVVSNNHNNAYPLRLFYTIGLDEGIVDRDAGRVITEKISDEYLSTHTDSSGNICFYTNRYTGMGAIESGTLISPNPEPGSKTVGNSYTTFTPAQDNPFYYVQENIPLFLDEACTQMATGELVDHGVYYFKISYYNGKKEETAVVSRTTESFRGNDTVDGILDVVANEKTGQLEIQKGRPRLGYLTDFVRDKDQHYPGPGGASSRMGGSFTGTASTFYYPTYVGNGQFKVYLGNNGKLTAGPPEPAVGSLTIQKTVTGEGLLPQEDFEFQIQLTAPVNGQLPDQCSYTGGVIEGSGADPVPDGIMNLTNGMGTIYLQSGQSVVIHDLPKGTHWRVTENLKDEQENYYAISVDAGGEGNASVSGSGASGLIDHHGDSDIVDFTNRYEVPSGTLEIKKDIIGQPSGDDAPSFPFKVDLTFPDGTTQSEVIHVTAGTPYLLTEKLPIGTSYQVTEIVDTDSDDSINLTDIAGTNTPQDPGQSDDDGQTQDPGQSDGDDTEGLDGSVQGNRRARIESVHNSKALRNMPFFPENRYTPLVQSYSGIIARKGKIVLPFVNAYNAQGQTGNLKISKILVGEARETASEFLFHLTFDGEGSENLNDKYISLKANEEIVIPDLPAGITYQIYEESSDGYISELGAASGMIAGGQTSEVVFRNMAEETSSQPAIHLWLPIVEKWSRGDQVPTNEQFTFHLKGENSMGEAAPMPLHGKDTVSVTYEGQASFGYVTFYPKDAGVYTYTIWEEEGSSAGWTYDSSVYFFTVTVNWEDETLTVDTQLSRAGSQLHQSAAVFYNDYINPSSLSPDPPSSVPDTEEKPPHSSGRPTGHSSAANQEITELPDTGINRKLPWVLAVIGATLISGAALLYRKENEGGEGNV